MKTSRGRGERVSLLEWLRGRSEITTKKPGESRIGNRIRELLREFHRADPSFATNLIIDAICLIRLGIYLEMLGSSAIISLQLANYRIFISANMGAM